MLGLGIPEMVLILVAALLIFGPKKLPEVGQSVGKALREFKKGMNDLKENFDNIVPEEPKEGNFGSVGPATSAGPVVQPTAAPPANQPQAAVITQPAANAPAAPVAQPAAKAAETATATKPESQSSSADASSKDQ